MFIYSIYRATNRINGKSYIGFTKNFTKRQQDHLKSARKPKTPFHKALSKYGPESFSWEIIFQGKNKDDVLEWAEPHFIQEFNTLTTTGQGYNVSYGGTMGPTLSGEDNGMYGRTHSYETRQKIKQNRTSSKGRSYEERYGPEKAKELRALRSESFKGRDNSSTKNPRFDWSIYKLKNQNTGEVFIGYRSDFIEQNKANRAEVCNMCSGKTKQYKGWFLISCFLPLSFR